MNTSVPSLTNAIFDPNTGEVMTFRKLIQNEDTREIWQRLFANELGRLANGVGSQIPTGTDTIFFIPHHKMPAD